ncbi:DNA cytosine methyltransferase [Aeromonas dhakensis]|uniref:DNA cytosine methyltransferase n=1 Tax=Aeromonas dhakensis TaxID=196024 RepID=UPI000F44815F|nr:DNA cytosine methyltransferase [Aeromonas dhakensis]MBL0527000.1 DNA cytosine methyltransferase [Aeromonas dhakensis]MBL0535392.1 DNA cytosine methyltransferase [Aeromonas dhakensis]TNI30337.1 modification methylase SinI [Aeromonas dhakensis]TNI42826.1 modification methylase SinI [Aeromonas dhakensis]
MESTILSSKDAALFLGVSEQYVRNLCRANVVSANRIGKMWLLEKSSLEKYKSQQESKTKHVISLDRNSMETVSDKPIAISFFSGAMGLDIGIERAGFDLRLACEVDKFCRQTISLNRPKSALLGDINNYSKEDILRSAGLGEKDEISLIVGGPPCQAFSTAGKRKAFQDERGNVFIKFIELAISLNPKYFIIENVRGLLSCPLVHKPHNERGIEFTESAEDSMKGGALNYILKMIKASGYAYSFNLYNSANFGTPQIRERVIIVCSRDGVKPPYIEPTHSESGLFGLPLWNNLNSCIHDISEHEHLNFPEKRIKFYKKLKPGQNWRSLSEEDQKNAMGKSYFSGGGKTGFFRRLAWDKPSPTLVTHPAMPATDLAHPEENRPLSIQEYKRIQEFPDDWMIAGPLIQKYKQIGNAVPVSVGLAAGRLIMKLIKGEEVRQFEHFPYSRYKNTDDISWELDFNKRKHK